MERHRPAERPILAKAGKHRAIDPHERTCRPRVFCSHRLSDNPYADPHRAYRYRRRRLDLTRRLPPERDQKVRLERRRLLAKRNIRGSLRADNQKIEISHNAGQVIGNI